MTDLFEQLAAIEHERWADWQHWVHKCAHRNADGSLTLSAGTVAHWERQIDTPYAELSEQEKESDREQVRRYWGLIHPSSPRRSVYSVCACGGMIRYDDHDRRMPCPSCGGIVTREEAQEAARATG